MRRVAFYSVLLSVLSYSILSAAVGVIQKVTQTEVLGSYNISFIGEGTLNYQTAFLDVPPHIVLDFPGVEYQNSPDALQPRENSFVSGIQSSTLLLDGKESLAV